MADGAPSLSRLTVPAIYDGESDHLDRDRPAVAADDAV